MRLDWCWFYFLYHYVDESPYPVLLRWLLFKGHLPYVLELYHPHDVPNIHSRTATAFELIQISFRHTSIFALLTASS